MAGVWVWAIQIMMPVPLVFVLLLALPTPRKVKSFIITVCKRILDLPTFGHMRLFHFALLVSSWMFVAQSWGAYSVCTRAASAPGLQAARRVGSTGYLRQRRALRCRRAIRALAGRRERQLRRRASIRACGRACCIRPRSDLCDAAC